MILPILYNTGILYFAFTNRTLISAEKHILKSNNATEKPKEYSFKTNNFQFYRKLFFS